jgi:hypothetical protein
MTLVKSPYVVKIERFRTLYRSWVLKIAIFLVKVRPARVGRARPIRVRKESLGMTPYKLTRTRLCTVLGKVDSARPSASTLIMIGSLLDLFIHDMKLAYELIYGEITV